MRSCWNYCSALGRPQSGNFRIQEGSIKVRIVRWVGTDVLELLDDVLRCWGFHRQMSSLRLETVVIGHVDKRNVGTVRSGVREVPGCTDTDRAARLRPNAVARFKHVVVRTVVVDDLVLLDHDGFTVWATAGRCTDRFPRRCRCDKTENEPGKNDLEKGSDRNRQWGIRRVRRLTNQNQNR